MKNDSDGRAKVPSEPHRIGRLVIFAEFERALIAEHTRAGPRPLSWLWSRAIVRLAKYPPIGNRGISGQGLHTGYKSYETRPWHRNYPRGSLRYDESESGPDTCRNAKNSQKILVPSSLND